MKFDFVIGNPPYQEQTTDTAPLTNGQIRTKNVFPFFQIAGDEIAENSTVLIYPGARWIHRSGKGMSKFGLSQINDPHLSRIDFWPDSNELFSGVDIADGITVVIKNNKKISGGFEYVYHKNGEAIKVMMDNPGEDLIPLNPKNIIVLEKVDKFVKKYGLSYLHDKILSQKLFGIESDFVEKNPLIVRPYECDDNIDFSYEIKLFTNDKAGKTGRAKWFVTNRNIIQTNSEYIDLWKVVVSSANAGGQKRDNQLEIFDNHSAFGRARVALSVFSSQEEAINFYNYCKTDIIKFMFLMTDEALTSLGKRVPDLQSYKNNSLINFSTNIGEQLNKLIGFSEDEIEYIKTYVNTKRKER